MKTATFQLEELTCPSCVKKIETAVSRLNGTSETKVLFNSSKVKVSFDDTVLQSEEIKKTISNLGYKVLN